MASPTSVALTGGYYWEGKFKGSVSNTIERYIFSLYDSVASAHRTLIPRNTATGLGLTHQSGSASGNTFVLYDGSFHTYRIEYESGQVRRYRDGALITANQTTTIAAPTDGNIDRVYLAGIFGTASADTGAPITLEYSEFGPLTTYTYARPTSDITTQWTPSTGTDHYALIDETTANDADYIYATAAGQTDEVRLASMSAPQAGTNLLINYKVAGIVGSASVTMSLRQGAGGTLIATDTAKNIDNTYQLIVPAATWSSTVTDWTDLRLRFVSA
jgi:hypothetical protein